MECLISFSFGIGMNLSLERSFACIAEQFFFFFFFPYIFFFHSLLAYFSCSGDMMCYCRKLISFCHTCVQVHAITQTHPWFCKYRLKSDQVFSPKIFSLWLLQVSHKLHLMWLWWKLKFRESGQEVNAKSAYDCGLDFGISSRRCDYFKICTIDLN